MRSFDPVAGILSFASTADGEPVSLAFSNFRRLTLTTPLRAVTQTFRGSPCTSAGGGAGA